MPKPSDLLLGVVELFAILLPGALLAASLIVAFDKTQLQVVLSPLLATTGAQWVAFALTAYAGGHLVFMLSAVLDDLFYDSYRRGKWPVAEDHAYVRATELRKDALPTPDNTPDAPMNTFAWAKARLLAEAPGAYAEVLRYEADSKFFRSLVIVLPIAGFALWWKGLPMALPVLFILGCICFFRYAERRHKSTEWAYRYVIVLDTTSSCRQCAESRSRNANRYQPDLRPRPYRGPHRVGHQDRRR